MVHIRLPKHLVKRIDHISVEWEKDRARTVETIIEAGLTTLGDQGGQSGLSFQPS